MTGLWATHLGTWELHILAQPSFPFLSGVRKLFRVGGVGLAPPVALFLLCFPFFFFFARGIFEGTDGRTDRQTDK